MSVMEYKCLLREADSNLQTFSYDIESITGALNSGIIKRIFPHREEHTSRWLRQIRLTFGLELSMYLGSQEIIERANDGDSWVCIGGFDVCLGGRHPSISEKQGDPIHSSQ